MLFRMFNDSMLREEGRHHLLSQHLPVMNRVSTRQPASVIACLHILGMTIILEHAQTLAGVYNKPILRTVGNNDDGNIIQCISVI